MTMPAHFSQGARLTRRDLIALEHRLREAVSRFLPFRAYSLYFPREADTVEPLWLANERKLLLPLIHDDTLLGVFVARGVSRREVRSLLPAFPGLMALCLENLALYKAGNTDAVTGLATRRHLVERMAREADHVRACFTNPPENEGDMGAPLHRACMGLVVLRLGSLRQIAREQGYTFADKLAAELARELAASAPEQALAARTGDYEFAVLIPAAATGVCRRFAEEAVQRLSGVSLPCGIMGRRVSVAVSAGYAIYPRDMEGALFERDMNEQARVLLRKARLAAAIAAESGSASGRAVMGFAGILAEGGTVLETHPLSRLVVSLGRSMNAREGQRFSVWSVAYPVRGGSHEPRQPLYKGELVLLEVREDASVAEILHLGDPAWGIEPGDRLTMLPEEKGGDARKENIAGQPDPLTGLYRHGDFLARWSAARDGCDRFALALVRLSDAGRELDGRATHPEQLMAEAAQLCRDHLGIDTLGGRYGLNSLVFYHPGKSPEEARACYLSLCEILSKRLRIDAAVGIGCHPFLGFRRADALDNSLKALEYALLLPAPHVGVFDSVALNISADKRFSLGDTFGAIEEYKQALLADDDNAMAWNSLGVCMAGLGRHSEARRYFEEVLRRKPDDGMALYNLGTVCQSLGETDEARKHYRKCLKATPGHVFSLLRLGQLAEGEKRYGLARQYYNKAARRDDAGCLVHRHLARLSMRQGRPDEAREHLHEALLRNPQDAVALQLMARLYLDGGEDPAMAEALSRQSVALRPDLKQGWLELARALEARGRETEAREALLKAGER